MSKKLEPIQRENRLNDVIAVDGPGPGGARHEYRIERGGVLMAEIRFQKGPRNDPASTPGVTVEDLLEIARDRLTDFQSGPFPSQATADALNHVTAALMALNTRTEDRAKRGVLGKDEA